MRRILTIFLLLLAQPLFAQSPAPLTPQELLLALIPIDTTNPPGNETRAAEWVRDYLQRFGIDSEILESAPGRGNLIARLRGKGEVEPVMLLGHLDVVPADPKEWNAPPLVPRIADGYLYGRGAIDMKGMAAMEIAAFVRLKEVEAKLKGDVLLVLVADEESGGKFGAEWLVEHHWDKIKSRFVFNEGSIGLKHGDIPLYAIQVAEKGVAWMKVTATGTSGHGSMPTRDNAVMNLMRALERVTRRPQPITATPIVEEFLSRLATHFSFPRSFLMRHFFSWPIRPLAGSLFGSALEKEKALNAMLRNTLVPTVLKAGGKTNVIPGEAVAELDARILPGETPEGFRQKVAKTAGAGVKVELLQESLATESPFHTPFFDALEAAILAHNPEALIAPYISPGATDNRFFRKKGITAYGLIPALITMEDLEGVHGKNERIPLVELQRGADILFDFIWKVQGDATVSPPAGEPDKPGPG